MDLSEQCGYSVASQIALFNNIKPLFANKLISIVVNKIDLMRPEQLDPATQEQLQGMLKSGEVEMLELSCNTLEGVMAVRNSVCDRLIAARNAEKLKAGTNSSGEPSGRLGELLRRIHVAQPLGGVTRETSIPEAVLNRKKYDKNDPDRPLLERDLEEADGGAGVYYIDLRKNYLLENDEWKHDRIPEVFKGQNVYDFIDPDIEAKLEALEAEEEKLEAEGFYESEEDLEDAEEAEIRYKAELIREKRQLIRNEAKMRKSLKNRAVIPRTAKAVKLSKMESHLESLGHDTSKVALRAQSQNRGRSLARGKSEGADGDAMDVDTPQQAMLDRAKSRGRSQSTNRRTDGVTNEDAATKAEKMAKLGQQKMNRMARQGEADRHQTGSLIKHLVCVYEHPRSQLQANYSLDCRKAWYWKDQQALNASTRLCFCFGCLSYESKSAGGKFMVGVQDASDTNSLITPTSVVMQNSRSVSDRSTTTSCCECLQRHLTDIPFPAAGALFLVTSSSTFHGRIMNALRCDVRGYDSRSRAGSWLDWYSLARCRCSGYAFRG
jgi:nucleolar GTP-binding protein